jgi:hypothetical protein
LYFIIYITLAMLFTGIRKSADIHGRNLRNANKLVGVKHRLAQSGKLTHVHVYSQHQK